jgi:hypothetical protein
MKKTLEEKGFKVVAVQDECFIGSENSKKAIIVLVRYEKQGKRNPIVKYDAEEFPNKHYLFEWMKEKGLKKAIPNEKFKAPRIEQVMHLIKAL